jgi:hypothetical protein
VVGDIPIPGNLSMDDLAATITKQEQLAFTELTALKVDAAPAKKRNMGTFVAQPNQLGEISICAAGAKHQGHKLFSTTAYVLKKATKIDVYRLPLPT